MSSSPPSPRLAYSRAELVAGLGLDTISKPRTQLSVKAAAGQGLPPEMFKVCDNGERTEHLTSLAGILINQRRPLVEVIQLAKLWNQTNTPPLDDPKVEATCESILKTHERNHPEDAAGNADALTPLFNIDDARVADFLANDPPKRRWLLQDCLPCGKVGAIVAPGGTGKSQLLLQLGVSIATGIPFLDHWNVPEPGGVLILAAEDDPEELHRRLHNISVELAIRHRDNTSYPADLKKNLYVRSMVTFNNLMTANLVTMKALVVTRYGKRLALTANAIPNLKLIVIDPASRFRGGDENSAQDTTRFIEVLEQVREKTGATLLVAHHTNKGSLNAQDQNQNASRGSSAFSDGVRWQMNLAPLTPDVARKLGIKPEMRRRYMNAAVVKNNYGPPVDDFLLQRADGGYLEIADVEDISYGDEEKLIFNVCEKLKSEAKEGRLHTRTSFEKTFGGKDKPPFKVGLVTLRNHLSRWIARGRLAIDDKES